MATLHALPDGGALTAAKAAARPAGVNWLPLQGALAEFIAAGHFARHVRRMRLVYEARHHLIGDVVRHGLSQLEVIPSAAGLHVSATAPDASVDGIGAVIRRARRAGVALHPLALFALERPPSAGLVLAYGAIATDRIEDGLELLHRCLQVTEPQIAP